MGLGQTDPLIESYTFVLLLLPKRRAKWDGGPKRSERMGEGASSSRKWSGRGGDNGAQTHKAMKQLGGAAFNCQYLTSFASYAGPDPVLAASFSRL